MIINQPLDQVSAIVAAALNKTAKVRKSYQKFFIETMILILTIYGKLNFLQLARHGESCESRFRQNFKKAFDWCAFNSGMCGSPAGQVCAIALDHSYLRKSGKKTPGIDYYWSGCAGAVKRGVEILAFAHVCAGTDDARFLFAAQTLPGVSKGRTPYYLKHMKDKRGNQTARCLMAIHSERERLLALSGILVGDCLFASYNFVTGAQALGFSVVSRLRDDAALHYLYTGPQKRGRGRKKELDGAVDLRELREGAFEEGRVEIDGSAIPTHAAVVRSKSLKRDIKVVIADLKCGSRTVRKILFSTDTRMSASDIFLIYHSRFQIEFLFRDAKQNTGLENWQSTDADRLAFGYNASLSAVNVAREFARELHEKTGRKLSVASVKKALHNAALYQYIVNLIQGPKSDSHRNNSALAEGTPYNVLFFGVRESA